MALIRAVYPATFDPIHYGHIDIARRAARPRSGDRVRQATAATNGESDGQQQAIPHALIYAGSGPVVIGISWHDDEN